MSTIPARKAEHLGVLSTEAERTDRPIAGAGGDLRLAFRAGARRVALAGQDASILRCALRDAAGDGPTVANPDAVPPYGGSGGAEGARADAVIDHLSLHVERLRTAMSAGSRDVTARKQALLLPASDLADLT